MAEPLLVSFEKKWNIVRWWLPAPDFNTIRFSRVRWESREKRTVCSDSAIQYFVSKPDLSGGCLFVCLFSSCVSYSYIIIILLLCQIRLACIGKMSS